LGFDLEELILEIVSENQKIAKFINLKPYGKQGKELTKVEVVKYSSTRFCPQDDLLHFWGKANRHFC
jgi:hypothetical protein